MIHSVSNAIARDVYLRYDKDSIEILNDMLTPEVVKLLSNEKKQYLLETQKMNRFNIQNTITMLERSDTRTVDHFKRLVCAYAYCDEFPEGQPLLTEVIDTFVVEAGPWRNIYDKNKNKNKSPEVMKQRLPEVAKDN